MAISRFARRILGLEAIFPSSDRSVPQPDTLDSVVQPVVLWPSNAASVDRLQRAAQTSTNALTPLLNLGTIGEGFYEEWLYASFFQSDAAVHFIIVNINDPAGAAVQVARISVPPSTSINIMNTGGTTAARRVWVPRGFSIDLIGETAGVAYNFTIQRILCVHPLSEPPIWP